MAVVNILGVLNSPIVGAVLSNSLIRFTSLTNFEEVTEGSTGIYPTDSSANYNFEVRYGQYEVSLLGGGGWYTIGKVTIDSNTITPLTLVDVLNS